MRCDCTFADVRFMILGLFSADGGMTVGLQKLSSLDGRRLHDTGPRSHSFKHVLAAKLTSAYVVGTPLSPLPCKYQVLTD